MCSKSKYCRCLNKYTVTECQKGSGNCDVPYYWFQGVGRTSTQSIPTITDVFDASFDSTFN